MPTALITGITGQDGSYLADLLLGKGYEVHGIIRRSSTISTARIDHIYQDPHEPDRKLHLHYGDMTDAGRLAAIVAQVRPDEVYNLAAQSHVAVSFAIPEYTADTVALGTLRLLEAMRSAGCYGVRFYQASSSELFGGEQSEPQNELTEFRPHSPYAVAKQFAYCITANYRQSYGMHASNGILFNHESPRRGETFVTRKITRAVARIKIGLENRLYLGNMDAQRDWGYAGDYVRAMWLMLQQDRPDDFVIATGETRTVRDFAEQAFRLLGLDYRDYVEVDKRYLRPTEVDRLCGDASKAKRVLGWVPEVTFDQLVEMMVKSDYDRERRGARGCN